MLLRRVLHRIEGGLRHKQRLEHGHAGVSGTAVMERVRFTKVLTQDERRKIMTRERKGRGLMERGLRMGRSW